MTAAIRVLVIDDETSARKRLLQFLAGEPDVVVLKECRNGLEACTDIPALQPDLVFLDVEMPEYNGLEVVAQIGVERMPLTIFVTAYDHYAVAAFDANATDYLLKPFDQPRFAKAMAKARQWLALARQPAPPETGSAGQTGSANAKPETTGNAAPPGTRLAAVLCALDHVTRSPERIWVRHGDAQQLIRTADIVYISADGNYIRLHTTAGAFQMRERMLGIIERLDPARFRRIHRSHIVNLDHVKKRLPWFGGDNLVMMADGTRLTQSRNYRDALREFD